MDISGEDSYGAHVQVKITPPNEGSSYSKIHIKPVRTEALENVVMRFGNNLIDGWVQIMVLMTDRLRLKNTP